MKAICDQCGHDWAIPDELIATLHPPRGANRFMQVGCEKCTEGTLPGWFYWRMEDGTTKGALAGVDELEEAGVVMLDMKRLSGVKP